MAVKAILDTVVSLSLITVMYIIPIIHSVMLLQRKSQGHTNSLYSKWLTYWIEITFINIVEGFVGFIIPIPSVYFYAKLVFCALLVHDR